MARITAHVGFNMDALVNQGDLRFYFENGTIQQSTSSVFSLRYQQELVQFTGSGFGNPDANGVPRSGTLTGFTYKIDGATMYSFLGLGLSIAELRAYVLGGDNHGLAVDLFSGVDTATGSAGNDTLLTFAGNDTLNGRGGSDLLIGDTGNDTYFVDRSTDRVRELAGEGTDMVRSSATYTLAANAEKLTLLGSAAIDGTGNAAANRLTGNGGANVLDGGRGKDTLAGGAGADKFLFDTGLNGSTNWDNILDFSAADDTVLLDRSVFSGILADGRLAGSAFHAGTAAHDLSDRIIFDQATGKIFYDPDGTGAAAKILFARVDAELVLTNADFIAVA